MSLNGIAGATSPIYKPAEVVRPRVEKDGPAGAGSTQEASKPEKAAGVGLLAPRREALPSEAPEGTDPELWQVLTAEERSYFARINAMGPLTYGRPSTRPTQGGQSPEPSVQRGGRIDVRA